MTRNGRTNHWTETAVAAAGNPIDLGLRLQLHTFEPPRTKTAAWHTWAKQAAGDHPEFASPHKARLS